MARNAEPILSRVESSDSDLEATQKIGVDWLTFASLMPKAPLFQSKIGIIWLFSQNYHQLLKVPFPGSQISWEIAFPGKTPFLGSHLSREVTFPGKPPFLGSHRSREVMFPRKSNFLGNHIKQMYECPNVPMSVKFHTCQKVSMTTWAKWHGRTYALFYNT